eukprot:6659038-Pyramimonas_sp.AAC.1
MGSLDALRYNDVPPRPCLDPLLLVAYKATTTQPCNNTSLCIQSKAMRCRPTESRNSEWFPKPPASPKREARPQLRYAQRAGVPRTSSVHRGNRGSPNILPGFPERPPSTGVTRGTGVPR